MYLTSYDHSSKSRRVARTAAQCNTRVRRAIDIASDFIRLHSLFPFSLALGQGWRLGFLGLLHMDVFKQRLEQVCDHTVIQKPSSFLSYCSFRNSSHVPLQSTAEKCTEVRDARATLYCYIQPITILFYVVVVQTQESFQMGMQFIVFITLTTPEKCNHVQIFQV